MFGASVSGGLHHMMSSSLSISGGPSSPFGGSPFLSIGQNKRYSQTVRSSASSIMSLSRNSKREPPVAVMTHYNSPYEKIFYGQPGEKRLGRLPQELIQERVHAHSMFFYQSILGGQNFVGREMKLGTICISTRAGQGSMHFLVRTIFVSQVRCLGKKLVGSIHTVIEILTIKALWNRNLSMSRFQTASEQPTNSKSIGLFTRKRTTFTPCSTWPSNNVWSQCLRWK